MELIYVTVNYGYVSGKFIEKELLSLTLTMQ